MNYDYQSLFLLDSKFIYLNHGSFGACFHDVHLKRINWIEKLEQNPVHFIDDIVIGKEGVEFGTTAKFTEPFGKAAGEVQGPVIPGPERKNPNTSLNCEFSNPKYS